MNFTLKKSLILIFLCLSIGVNGVVLAIPDLSKTMIVDDAKVLGDRENDNIYYLVPKGVRILEQADGGPHISLSLLQYVGSNPREDIGSFEIYSSFRIRVGLEKHSQEERAIIQSNLSQQLNQVIELSDLPVDQITANLVSSVGGEIPLTQSGQFDESTSTRPSSITTAWTERDLVMSYAADEAELLERILKQREAGLSLTYSIGSRAWRLAPSEIEGNLPNLNSTSDLSDPSAEQDLISDVDDNQTASIEIVLADAIPLRVADEFLESRIKRYFLDGALPASYPSLVVYYFDIKNGNSGEIFIRSVEIEAVGVGGGKTRYSALFEVDRPQDYAASVRFPYAVNLIEPYRWRAIDVLQTGEVHVGPWTENDNWSTVINASGPLQPAPTKPTHGGEQ